MKNIKLLFLLHILLAMFSLTGVASKFAAAQPFLSTKFIMFYALVLLGLFIYAFAWQQIIKRMPLVTAYANRGATVIWGIIWGYLVFSEEITVKKLIGAAVIICGIVLIVTAEAKEETEEAGDTDNGYEDKTA